MIIVFIIAITIHVVTLLFAAFAGFSYAVNYEVIFYSTFDLLLSFSAVWLAIKLSKTKTQEMGLYYKNVYVPFFERKKLLLLLLCIWTAFHAYESYGLIVAGVLRHDLLQEYDVGGFDYMFLSGFFKILAAFVIMNKSSMMLKMLSFSGLLLSIVITASRSELNYVIFFMIVLIIFANKEDLKLLLNKVIFVSTTLILLAILSTSYLQNRPISDGLDAVFDITRNFFTYRAYGYYLADHAILAGEGYDKIFFPFLGYISETFNKIFGGSYIPINSEFVSYLHYLGTNPKTGGPYLANVLYPWWSWFVGAYGPLGLLIKAAFVAFCVLFCIRLRLLFTLTLFLNFALLGTSAAHPLMTLTHVFAFIVTIFIDSILKLPRIALIKKGSYVN